MSTDQETDQAYFPAPRAARGAEIMICGQNCHGKYHYLLWSDTAINHS